MSTKIYDGIILNISEEQLWKTVSQIRENIENTFTTLNTELTIEYLKQSYIESALRTYRNTIGIPIKDDKQDRGLFFNALEKWKTEKEDFFKDKLTCKVQIFEPLENGRILGYVFTNNEQKYYENILTLPFIEEFGYWNNTDKPDELTDGEWKNRYQSWTTILDRNFFFTGSGITVELPETKSRTFAMPSEELIKEINNIFKDERNDWLTALSIRLISDIVINKNKDTLDASLKTGSMSELMNIMHTTMDVIKDSPVEKFPIGQISSLSMQNLMDTNVNNIEFAELTIENIDELVYEVEKQIGDDLK